MLLHTQKHFLKITSRVAINSSPDSCVGTFNNCLKPPAEDTTCSDPPDIDIMRKTIFSLVSVLFSISSTALASVEHDKAVVFSPNPGDSYGASGVFNISSHQAQGRSVYINTGKRKVLSWSTLRNCWSLNELSELDTIITFGELPSLAFNDNSDIAVGWSGYETIAVKSVALVLEKVPENHIGFLKDTDAGGIFWLTAQITNGRPVYHRSDNDRYGDGWGIAYYSGWKLLRLHNGGEYANFGSYHEDPSEDWSNGPNQGPHYRAVGVSAAQFLVEGGSSDSHPGSAGAYRLTNRVIDGKASYVRQNDEPTDVGTCEDLPGWTSETNHNCYHYENFGWCRIDGGYGSGWEDSWGVFADWANVETGIIATEACCACGGGLHTPPAKLKDSLTNFVLIPDVNGAERDPPSKLNIASISSRIGSVPGLDSINILWTPGIRCAGPRRAESCGQCGSWPTFCGGDCAWSAGICAPIEDNSVWCGQHRASNCNACPEPYNGLAVSGSPASWCGGECIWSDLADRYNGECRSRA